MIGVLKGSIKKYIKIENLYIRNKISINTMLRKYISKRKDKTKQLFLNIFQFSIKSPIKVKSDFILDHKNYL